MPAIDPLTTRPQPLHVVFVLSNLTVPALEGQHSNHLLLMRGLAQQGVRVGMICLARRTDQIDRLKLASEVPGLEPAVVLSSRLNYPLLLLRHLLPWPVPMSALARSVAAVTQQFPSAVLHLEGIGLLPLVPQLKGTALVVTTTDAWSLRQQRLAGRETFWPRRLFLHAYAALSGWAERRFLPLAGAAQVVSPADAAYLVRQAPTARIACIPIALPAGPLALKDVGHAAQTAKLRVLFWGDIRVAHIADGLRWLLTEVLPLVRFAVDWVVLGRGEPPDALQHISPAVQFVSWVENIDDFLHGATIVVLPDAAGTGLKNRAIHAMACGVPVVGTPSAFEGFPVMDGRDALVRATPQTFADAINELLGDPLRAQQIAQAGRNFAIDGYSQPSVIAQWLALYQSVVCQAGAKQ